MKKHRFLARWCAFAVFGALAACSNEGIAPVNDPPARIDAATDVARTASVASAIANGIVVTVSDASGRPVAGAAVALAVTLGNGSTNPRVAVTDAKGQASATWYLGTIVGPNEVTASVTGVATSVKFTASGTAGPVNTISLSPQNVRLLVNTDSTRITALSLDAFGNTTAPAPTFVVRDSSLVTVDSTGVVRALRRGAGTYVIASANGKSDSVLVTVLAVGQSVCTAAAAPLDLAIGQVVTDVSGLGFCVHASSDAAEYAVIPYYNSGVPSATVQVEVRGQGLTPLSLSSAIVLRRPSVQPFAAPAPSLVPDDAFESRLRDRERVEAARRTPAAGSALSVRRDMVAAAAATVPVVPAIGDILKLNVNAIDFCDNPDFRTGRVVAITDKAIIVADTANPVGGFTTAEYQSIGVTFDTLVDPVDRAAFGAPTDIDNNGHVIMFFTRAVNEMTAAGSSAATLGFFYSRDLYPKIDTPTTNCPGSNFAEMFYLLVPDSTGVVNGNVRTKTQVVSFTNGTVAHEYQHLINASRRKYVNNSPVALEEKWLDEGLAHSAEDLNFYRASGHAPRTNVDASIFSDPRSANAYSTFGINNVHRYQTYLATTGTQSPIGFDAFDTDLQTRGAIWNFLRFAVDHLPASQESAFWFNLVNSKTSGIANLTNVLGFAPNSLLRDWAISVFMDDNAPNVDPRFQEPSWNLRSVITNNGTSVAFPLTTRILTDNAQSQTTLAGNGVAFFRFSVPKGQDALFTVTSGGQPLPVTVQLAVVRVR